MVEAAQGTVSEIDGRARDAAEGTRREALASMTRVAEEVGRLERELAQLRRGVAAEADGLRAKLDRSRLLHASAVRSDAAMALPGTAAPPKRGALSAPPETDEAQAPDVLVEEVSGHSTDGPYEASERRGEDPASAGETPSAPAEDTEAEAEERLDADVTPPQPTSQEPGPSADDRDEQPDPAPPEPLVSEDAPVSTGTHDLAETRARMAEASDLELAELYLLAGARADGPVDSEEEASYWPAVVHATVEEATGRPNFGQTTPDDAATSRKAKKQRAKTFKPLLSAREEALGAVEGPPPIDRDGSEEAPASEPAEDGLADTKSADTKSADIPEDDDSERDEDPAAGGARRGFLSKATRRRSRTFMDVPGRCAVCGKTFQADSEEELVESGWLVNDQVGLCPEDQKLGWELPPGRPVPYRRGGGD